MSDLLKINTPSNLIPTTEIVVPDQHIASHPYFAQVACVEGGPYGGNSTMQNIATFEVNAPQGAWDLFHSTLEFDAVCQSGTTGVVDCDGHSFFKRVRLMTRNGTVLQDSQAYNVRHAMELVATVGSANCAANFMSGRDQLPLAIASKQNLTTSQHYILKPDLSIFKKAKVLHPCVMGGLRLEFTFDNDFNVSNACSNVTTSIFKITGMKLNCRIIPLEADYIDKLRKAAAKGKLLYNYESDYLVSAPWTSTSNSVAINYGVRSAQALLMRWYLSGDVNVYNTKYIAKSQYLAGLTSLQLQHGSEYIPAQALAYPEAVMMATQQAFNTFGDADFNCLITKANQVAADSNDASAPLFVACVDLSKGGANSGLDLDQASLIVKASHNAIANLQIQSWLYYSTVVQILGPDNVLVSN